jgi:hypothetical protein
MGHARILGGGRSSSQQRMIKLGEDWLTRAGTAMSEFRQLCRWPAWLLSACRRLRPHGKDEAPAFEPPALPRANYSSRSLLLSKAMTWVTSP